MAINRKLYPLDYAQTGASNASALEAAVQQLESEARATALRQSNTKRILGQHIVRNQNSIMFARSIPLPLNKVGRIQKKLPFKGTVGFFLGGRQQ